MVDPVVILLVDRAALQSLVGEVAEVLPVVQEDVPLPLPVGELDVLLGHGPDFEAELVAPLVRLLGARIPLGRLEQRDLLDLRAFGRGMDGVRRHRGLDRRRSRGRLILGLHDGRHSLRDGSQEGGIGRIKRHSTS
jgi:hypothetical protein